MFLYNVILLPIHSEVCNYTSNCQKKWSIIHVGVEVLKAVIMKSSVFWDIMPCIHWKSTDAPPNISWLSTDYTALYSRREKYLKSNPFHNPTEKDSLAPQAPV
jgi:hypothetical protein